MLKIKSEIVLAVLIIVVGIGLVTSGVFGKQPGQSQNTQIQIIKITKTYLDWQNSPITSDNISKSMEITGFPAGTEIISGYFDRKQVFAPDISGSGGDFVFRTATGKSCNTNQGFNPGDEEGIIQNASLNLIFCYPDEASTLFIDASKERVDTYAQGIMDIYIFYIVH